ncbi:MAG: DUF4296 domain-containing protein [Breznakibacter sp.]
MVVAVSCKDRVPSQYPNKKEMVDILVDIHMAESILTNQRPGRTVGENLSTGMYKSILDKYGLTKVEFDSALIWYTSHPHVYIKVYDDVIARLSDMEAQIASDMSKQEEKDKLLAEKMATKNIWNDSISYHYPYSDSTNTNLVFKLQVDSFKLGHIQYSAIYRFQKEDLKRKTEFWMVTNYADSTRDTLKTDIIKIIPAKNTIATQELEKDKYLVGIEVFLLKHELDDELEIDIDSISLEYIPSQNVADYE